MIIIFLLKKQNFQLSQYKLFNFKQLLVRNTMIGYNNMMSLDYIDIMKEITWIQENIQDINVNIDYLYDNCQELDKSLAWDKNINDLLAIVSLVREAVDDIADSKIWFEKRFDALSKEIKLLKIDKDNLENTVWHLDTGLKFLIPVIALTILYIILYCN